VNIDLPKVSATPLNQDSEPLKVQIDSQGNVFLQDDPVQLPELVAKLQAISQDQKDRRIFLRGDKANSYERVLQVMATIIQGGFTKVALLTDPSGAAPGTAAPAGAPTPVSSPATNVPAPPAASPRRPGNG
jgi:biopolymer transport protein TolR